MKTCPTCRTTYPDSIAFCSRDGAALDPSGALQPGVIIRNKYQILSEIAQGGMGVVYHVRHLLWNEDRAIKLLLDVHPRADQRSDGILSEALVLRQLQHPNIVRVEDADITDDDQLFIVMEFVAGESISGLIRGGPLPWRQALELAAQACAGLSAAHQKGVIHRDIKPSNLLVAAANGSEIVKIIDFGIAKVREDAGIGVARLTTQSGLFVGTPDYASPEQAQGSPGSALDARTDIYSLGLVLYEMLTGARPFTAETTIATLLLRLQNPPTAPRRLRPELNIPPAVSDLVMKALATNRDARYASADEMRQAIEAILQRPAAAVKKSRVTAPALAALVAGAALGVWIVMRRPPQPPVKPAPPPVAAPVVSTAPPSVAALETPAKKNVPMATGTVKKSPAVTPTPPPERRTPGLKTKINPQDGLEYIWIPPGSFTMGCSTGDLACRPNEHPAHQVTITKGFWIGKTEVTQAAFERVSGRNPSNFVGANLPVESITWRQAHMFCGTVGMRLPTEAEWEYAARGNSADARYGSPTEIAWLLANSGQKTHEVAQKRPNAFGLYDMLGNVGEWTADWYAPYSEAAASDPRNPDQGEYHIVRGGYWSLGVFAIRVSHRLTRYPAQRGPNVGFRCAGD